MKTPSRAGVLGALALSLLVSRAWAQPAPTPAPVTDPVPVADPAPVTDSAPVADPAPVVDPAPVTDSAPVAVAKPDDAVSWKYDKGFIASSADGEFELKAGLRNQIRFDATRTEAKDEFESKVYLPRIRLQLEGFAYGEQNLYKLEYDFGNKGFSALKDFFIERAFTKTLRLRLGQWKKPFSRQELTSDFALAFPDRQLSGEWAGAGRDIGLALHSGYEKSPDGLEWAIGVFNGTTEKSTIKTACAPDATDPSAAPTCTSGLPSNVPTDVEPEAVARVGWNQGGEDGIKGYSELDLEGGPLRFAAGAAYRIRFHDFVDSSTFTQAAELDAILKVEGFDLSGAVFLVKDGEADAEFGGYGQAGYVAVPKRLAIIARSGVTPEDGTKLVEILGGVNILGHGHNQKLVIDGGVVRDTEGGTNNVVASAQAQFVF